MDILKYFKKKKQPILQKKAQTIIPGSPVFSSYVLNTDGSPLNSAIAMQIYEENGAVATSVDKIAEPIEDTLQDVQTRRAEGCSR